MNVVKCVDSKIVVYCNSQLRGVWQADAKCPRYVLTSDTATLSMGIARYANSVKSTSFYRCSQEMRSVVKILPINDVERFYVQLWTKVLLIELDFNIL